MWSRLKMWMLLLISLSVHLLPLVVAANHDVVHGAGAASLHDGTIISTDYDMRKAPQWPNAYKVLFKFYVPFVARYQSGPLEYDMIFFRNTKAGLQKVIRDHSEVWIENGAQDRRWYVAPGNASSDSCICEKMTASGGPTRRLLGEGTDYAELLSPALPDLSGPHWNFEAHITLNSTNGSERASVWHYSVTNNAGYGDVTTSWKMTVTSKGVPVSLDMWGDNWFTGGHWDHYVAQFYGFEADPRFDNSEFTPPHLCDGLKPLDPDAYPLTGGHHLTARLHNALAGILPSSLTGDAEYDAHAVAHGRTHAHRVEYDYRRALYHTNKELVAALNADPNATYKAALNHLADYSEAEYQALKKIPIFNWPKPMQWTKRGTVGGIVLKEFVKTAPRSKGFRLQGRRFATAPTPVVPSIHKPTWPLHMLPSGVDWRGSLADSVVKDQAMCGSCWAFSAVAPMEAAYYRHYGELKLLSEQYLMDCSWEYGNKGCNGGEQPRAFSFAVSNGGIPSNADYPYKGVNMPCKKDTPLTVAFSSYVNVEARNREHLKEAILTMGPMTISLDADDPGFRFYKTGIFKSSSCKFSPMAELDHAIMVSGYGRDAATGQEYWIVKNVWTTYWGEGGYARIDMDRDCGVTTLPEYVKLDIAETERLASHHAAS